MFQPTGQLPHPDAQNGGDDNSDDTEPDRNVMRSDDDLRSFDQAVDVNERDERKDHSRQL